MKSGLTTQYIHSQTQDSIELYSRTQSYDHSILIKDLDSRCFSIIDEKPKLSMIVKDLPYTILTQTNQEYTNNHLVLQIKRLQTDTRTLKTRVFQLQDLLQSQRHNYQSSLRLKQIAQSQYINGIKNMYERNTKLNQQNILYEKQLKSAAHRISSLQKQLAQSNTKSKMRIQKQMELELKIKNIEEKYHEKIMALERNYQKERVERDNAGREWRFQIESLKEEVEKYKRVKKQMEIDWEVMNRNGMEKQKKILELNSVKVQNDNLILEVKGLKQEIMRMQKENIRIEEKQKQMEKLNIKQKQKIQKYQSQDHLNSSTIAALAIQNISLKHQNAESSKNLHILSDKVRSYQYQTEIYCKDIDKQNHNFQRSQSQQRSSFRKERYSSVQRKNTLTMPNQLQYPHSQHQSNFYSNANNLSLNQQSYGRNSLRDHRRHRHQDSLNEILVKKCKELNQSLYV